MAAHTDQSTLQPGDRFEMTAYDAGLLGSYGGGDVGWWQDYLRAELDRAHDHYAAQHEALLDALTSTRERAERAEAERDDSIVRWCIRMADIREASGVGVKPMLDEVPDAIKARVSALEARATAAEALLREAGERLQAITDWADYALSNPQEFDSHGVKNLDGPVFDEARALAAKLKAGVGE